MRRRFSRPLLPGMTIGLIAPASPVYEKERRDAAVKLLEDIGYRVKRGVSVDVTERCYYDTETIRAKDLTDMFLDDEVDAVVCIRGGYGCMHLLPKLDLEAIAKHPKPFVGFSDITAMHSALHTKCGFITFHGPMPGAFDAVGLREKEACRIWQETLAGERTEIVNPDGSAFVGHGHRTVSGRLIGGNLTLIAALNGTPWEPEWEDSILLVEDVNERFDKIDSMVFTLKEHGVFDKVKGVIVGDFSHFDGEENMQMAVERIFEENLPKGMPWLSNVHAGHGKDRTTVALGAKHRLDPIHGTLTLTEKIFR